MLSNELTHVRSLAIRTRLGEPNEEGTEGKARWSKNRTRSRVHAHGWASERYGSSAGGTGLLRGHRFAITARAIDLDAEPLVGLSQAPNDVGRCVIRHGNGLLAFDVAAHLQGPIGNEVTDQSTWWVLIGRSGIVKPHSDSAVGLTASEWQTTAFLTPQRGWRAPMGSAKSSGSPPVG